MFWLGLLAYIAVGLYVSAASEDGSKLDIILWPLTLIGALLRR